MRVAEKFIQGYPAGEVIFLEGSMGNEMFVVLSGAVDIVKEIDGEARVVATLGAGEMFGEMALLDAQPRSAHALADRASVLKALSRSNFAKLREQHPSLFAKMLQNIAHEMSIRLRLTNQQLRALED